MVERFDSVVFCIPVPDLFRVAGLLPGFPASVAEVLGRIGYDGRHATAAVFRSPAICDRLSQWFASARELSPTSPLWELLAFKQSVTVQTPQLLGGGGNGGGGGGGGGGIAAAQGVCALVGHTASTLSSTDGGGAVFPSNEAALLGMFAVAADGLGLPVSQLVAAAAETKVIDWRVAQMVRPIDAVAATTPDPPLFATTPTALKTAAFAAAPTTTAMPTATPTGPPSGGSDSGGGGDNPSGSTKPGLIVTGDFMTHSSFVGCFAAASAAASVCAAELRTRTNRQRPS